jgi:2-oxoglutarate ferredoxin oxidoreductase subunit beta
VNNLDPRNYDIENIDIAWCPGCGNYGILEILKASLAELDIPPENLVIVSGIGQAAKIPHYLRTNFFNGLHGRSLPVASAIKASNPGLTVLAESGDGCMYGEGGNHFIQAIRRNSNITNIVHNNMVYGLTKGQASPTSDIGFKTPIQVDGVFHEPFNPLSIAIALDASFVARAYAGDSEKTKAIMKKAILHKGYALVDILQPCVVYNKMNTYKWFAENTYYLKKSYEPANRVVAFKRAIEKESIPLGIFYTNTNKPTFEENLSVYHVNKNPLYKRKREYKKLQNIIDSKRVS